MADSRILILEGLDAHPRQRRVKHAIKRSRRGGGAKTAAQRKFAEAAHSCAVKFGGGARNRRYLSCMKEKLRK